jgi:hypothetical protein
VRWRHLLVIPPPQPALKSLTSHSGPRGTAFFSPSVPAKLLGRDWPPLNCHILCIKSVPKLLECLIPTSRPSEEEELLGEKHTQGVKSPVFWLLSFSSPSLQSQNLKTQTTLRAWGVPNPEKTKMPTHHLPSTDFTVRTILNHEICMLKKNNL